MRYTRYGMTLLVYATPRDTVYISINLSFSFSYEGKLAKATDDTNSTRAWIIKKKAQREALRENADI